MGAKPGNKNGAGNKGKDYGNNGKYQVPAPKINMNRANKSVNRNVRSGLDAEVVLGDIKRDIAIDSKPKLAVRTTIGGASGDAVAKRQPISQGVKSGHSTVAKRVSAVDTVKDKASSAISFAKTNIATKGGNTATKLDDKVYSVVDSAKKKVNSTIRRIKNKVR